MNYEFLKKITVNGTPVTGEEILKEEDNKVLIIIGELPINESMSIVDKKYKDVPIILVRSSYEHEQGDTNKTRSRHRAGIKVIRPGYGKEGLEVFTTNKKGDVVPTLPENSEWLSTNDKKIVYDFIKRYHTEIDIIYDAKPDSKLYKDTILLLKEKIEKDKKYIVKRYSK